MNQHYFFIASDLSPYLPKVLEENNIRSKHASSLFLETSAGQLNYCFSYNMTMVTQCETIYKLCLQVKCPVIILKEDYSQDEIKNKILSFIANSKQLKNSTA